MSCLASTIRIGEEFVEWLEFKRPGPSRTGPHRCCADGADSALAIRSAKRSAGADALCVPGGADTGAYTFHTGYLLNRDLDGKVTTGAFSLPRLGARHVAIYHGACGPKPAGLLAHPSAIPE